MFRRFDDEEAVAEDELVKVMSLTLGWTKPSRAVNLLERGANAGLLDDEDGAYRAAFDPSEVDVPFGFEPEDECFEPPSGSTSTTDRQTTDATAGTATEAAAQSGEPVPEEPDEPTAGDEPAGEPAGDRAPPTGEGILDELLEAIAEHLDGSRKRAVAEANAKQEEMGGLVTLDAAALLVAKEQGIDVREHARAVLDGLRDEAA